MQNAAVYRAPAEGLYRRKAILLGGLGVIKVSHGVVGCIPFYMFIVAPKAGANLFADPAIGEYCRAFVFYGVGTLGFRALAPLDFCAKSL